MPPIVCDADGESGEAAGRRLVHTKVRIDVRHPQPVPRQSQVGLVVESVKEEVIS